MTSCTGSARRILGILKKVSWVENWTPNEKGRLSGLAEARRICALRAPHEMAGGRWKSQIRKNVYLFPYVEEPLNSKVIKSFVPDLRSRKCFSCFEIPMFYENMLWPFYIRYTYPYLAMVQWYKIQHFLFLSLWCSRQIVHWDWQNIYIYIYI